MINISNLGLVSYLPVWKKMQEFTANRTHETEDELWLLEHYPVYTLGQAGKLEHIFKQNEIPLIHTDRGGQITYHGPGQLIAYPLLDLRRRNLGIKTLVNKLEEILIMLLAEYNIISTRHPGAPGIYVGGEKIASLGLRVKKGCTYHGIALNVMMDLSPFANINPCGFENLKMTQMSSFVPGLTITSVSKKFSKIFCDKM